MEIELFDIKHKDIILKQLIEKISINSLSITEPSLNSIFIEKVKEVDPQK